MAQSNGGITQSSRVSAYPMFNPATGQAGLYAFDAPGGGFNDLVNPSTYFYKMEQVVPGKTPTINAMIVTYRDLGLATLTFTITASDDNQTVQSFSSGPVILGNRIATGRIMTIHSVGFTPTATGQNLQLSWSRAAGAGSVSIVQVILQGTVESS